MNQTDKLLKLLNVELPIIQAPMAGATTPELVGAVSNAGGLGAHGVAMLSVEQMTADAERIRGMTNRSYMLSFFCHADPGDTSAQERVWMDKLSGYYKEFA